MTSIAKDPSGVDPPTSVGAGPVDHSDPLRAVIHLTLAVYLLPVVAIVCAIGGISILVGKVTRPSGRSTIERPRAAITWKRGHWSGPV